MKNLWSISSCKSRMPAVSRNRSCNNGPIWTDHHRQHSSIITQHSDCYLPFRRTDRWLAMLYGPVWRLRPPAGTDPPPPARYISPRNFLQMWWRFTGWKLDSDKDLWLIRRAQRNTPSIWASRWDDEVCLLPVGIDETLVALVSGWTLRLG